MIIEDMAKDPEDEVDLPVKVDIGSASAIQSKSLSICLYLWLALTTFKQFAKQRSYVVWWTLCLHDWGVGVVVICNNI